MIEADSAEITRRTRRRAPHADKGGVRRRGDSVVSPQPRSGVVALVRARAAHPAALEWQEARLPVLGRLWATANAPHGAIFRFTLPSAGERTS